MKVRKRFFQIFISMIIIILLILYPSTATLGAYEGIDICIKAVIPALFPFFVATTYLNNSIIGHSVPLLSHLCKLLNFPNGGESLLLLGLIGGYPVGARLISEACHSQQITKRTSKILLGYCNNAGPAFIFGITASMFSSICIPIILWGLHILSALLTGYLLPRPEFEYMHWDNKEEARITSALKQSLSICAIVCGWIILFKVVLSYLDILLRNFPGNTAKVLLAGFIELSNGCLQLECVPSMSLRFILCSTFLAFGGLCVIFQTASAAESIGLGLYIHGKIMQTAISIIGAIFLSYVLFPNEKIIVSYAICTIISCVSILLIAKGSAKRYGNSLKNGV